MAAACRWPVGCVRCLRVLDGATHNNPYDNLNLPLPFPDALQEFRADGAMTAQNRTHSGGAVSGDGRAPTRSAAMCSSSFVTTA
jgi:hypothetical protein